MRYLVELQDTGGHDFSYEIHHVRLETDALLEAIRRFEAAEDGALARHITDSRIRRLT